MTADPPENGPELVEMPSQRMAVLYVKGRPDRVFPPAITALLESLYALKFARARRGETPFTIGRVRVRFPDAHLLPVEEWTTVVGLPVPETTKLMPQRIGAPEVRLETWEYGTVAQLHRGARRGPEGEHPVAELLRFIEDRGHVIVGAHEEEYAAAAGTLTAEVIRYPVRPR